MYQMSQYDFPLWLSQNPDAAAIYDANPELYMDPNQFVPKVICVVTNFKSGHFDSCIFAQDNVQFGEGWFRLSAP